MAVEGRCGDRMHCEDNDCGPVALPGGIALAAGLATGATGLVLWRRYGTATAQRNARGGAAASSEARLRLTPAAGPRWTGLALTGSF